MNRPSRREFLSDVGRGMLVASLGATTAMELGMLPSLAGETDRRLTFGPLEPLVSMMQETPPDKLLPLLVERLRSGADLKSLVSSAALANARAFGGQDYAGYHTFMALLPAYQMASELPSDEQALPVLKVIYRNSSRLQEAGADRRDVLHEIESAELIQNGHAGERLREAVRAADWNGAESHFAAIAHGSSPGEAFNHVQFAVQDEVDVHRVVLAWRAWAMLGLAGEQFAHTLLRQSVRYCLDVEQRMEQQSRSRSAVRDIVPKLLDEYRLLGPGGSRRDVDDGWVEQMAQTIFNGRREQAAEAVAEALAEGIDPEAVGEAISLAANLLVLHDPGRREEYSSIQKPPGCVHGDSVGVHASDAANAWRNIARASDQRNRVVSLLVGAYHTAGQTGMVTQDPYPYAQILEEIDSRDARGLLREAEEAIQSNDQARACAVVHRYGELGLPPQPVFQLMLRYAVSEDGALHAEKYYRTVVEEFAATRPAFRWRQLIALARVTASEHGFPAPGHAEARELLGLS
jgi:hypothetical protein